MQHQHNFLVLGDSYTIGESVLLTESFPYQTVLLLRQSGKEFTAPEVIAKTGWTTDELQAAVDSHCFLTKYDFVSLLIGVNNQYRGLPINAYKEDFEKLLQQAIKLAGGKPERVIVLSIPDYSVTPFARDADKKKIHSEIDQFNALNRAISVQYKTAYLDITSDTRAAENDPDLIAADGLHPSAKAYGQWAQKLVAQVVQSLKH